MVSSSVNWTSATEARIVCVRSLRTSTLTAGGIAACSCGSAALIAVHGLDDVGARLLEDRQQIRLLAVRPGRERGVLRRVDGAADVADAHRRAVLVGDDDVVPGAALSSWSLS